MRTQKESAEVENSISIHLLFFSAFFVSNFFLLSLLFKIEFSFFSFDDGS